MRKLALTSAQTAIMMAILTLISKLIGFVREMVMANFFGTSFVTDAYAMAFTILTLLFGGIIAAISTAYMPLYSNIVVNRGKTEGDQFTSKVINLLFSLTALISLLGIFFSDQIISIFASGFVGETASLASYFIKVLFSYVIFSSAAGILESYLQYKGVFLPQIITGYLISICTIAAIIVSAYVSYYYLAFGLLIGYALRLVSILIIVKKNQFQYHFVTKPDQEFNKILRMAIPTYIGSSMLYINQFIDKTLASRLIEGSISALNYAWLLNGVIIGITITILSTIIYPKLTNANSLAQYDRFNAIIKKGMNIVLLIALPCSLGAMVYSQPIVRIVFERGAFDSTATAMTSSAFFYYSMGMLFMSANELITKAYYSIHDMKLPMIFAAITVIINISLCLVFLTFMDHSGLALATSIASFCNLILLSLGIRRKYPHIKLYDSKSKIIKTIIAAMVSVGASYAIYMLVGFLLIDTFIVNCTQLGLSVLSALIIYYVILKIYDFEELELLKSVFRRNN
ncbi:murein biosynthesis integral membrane protein MurJ [Anoxybacterium hadale]|uniref:Murein biosynthesis integral membrane protein MurJ n=1 Tax=Anoxybacterium hadale TaxID=3408580 RepID=A0ACD1AEX3_9FIRM|nr:murein biosynthesis integral membrane protein MurJ [Clostridiales bacterium]